MKNQYMMNIVEKMEKQTNKGIEKYGQILEQNVGLSMEERLVHLQEELIDGLFYVEHLITKDKEQKTHKEDMVGIISHMMIQIPMIQDENTREIFLDIARQFNGVVKELV